MIRCAAGQDLGNKTLSSLATALLTAEPAVDSLPRRPRSIARAAAVNARESTTARPMQGSTARATTPLYWRQLAEAGSIIYSHAVRGLDSMSGVGLLYGDRVVPAVA